MTKEQTLQLYMRNLSLTREAAEQMWQDEQEDNLPELTLEQKAVEKEMMRADRKKEETPRKRERKPDMNKQNLIQLFALALNGESDVDNWIITNPEREIEFTYNGEKYRLTLSKPRKEKNA